MALGNAGAAPGNPTGKVIGDPPPDVPRDRWKRPKIKQPDGTVKAYTRASTLGGTLEDQYGLGQWRMRQVAFGMGRREDLYLAALAIRTNEGEDKARLEKIAEQAMEAAESNAAATVGTALHALSERHDRGEALPNIGRREPALEAYRAIIAGFDVHGIEEFVVCDEHCVAGTFDRLISPRGVMTAPDGTRITPDDRIVGDLKTSGTANYFGLKFAVQLAEYAHGTPYSHEGGRRLWADGIAPRTDWGLIIHVPSGLTDPSESGLYWVDLESGRELSALSIRVRTERARKDLVRPALPPGGEMPAALDSAGLMSLIRVAGSRDDAMALWTAHASLWTEDHTEATKARLAELAAG